MYTYILTQVFQTKMDEHEEPEILRLPLEEVCLKIKVCNMGSIKTVLEEMLDCPQQMMIDNAINTLCDVCVNFKSLI